MAGIKKFVHIHKTSTFRVLVIRLLIVLVMISLSRLMIYFLNPSLFPDPGPSELFRLWFLGLRFDAFTLCIFNIPFILLYLIPVRFRYNKLYRSITDLLFYLANTIILALNFIDVVFIRFQFKRMTMDIFDLLAHDQNAITLQLADYVADFWPYILLFLAFTAILVFLCSRWVPDPARLRSYRMKNFVADTGLFLLAAALTFLGARGGIQSKPIGIISAGLYTTPVYAPVILNTPYTILKTKDETFIKPRVFFNKEKATALFNPVKNYSGHGRSFKGPYPNIVLIILESFSAEHSAYLCPEIYSGPQAGYTPFLDSIMKKGDTYKGYANGKDSMESMPALLASLPDLVDSPYLNSQYVFNDLNTIPSLLGELGYSSAFFHGGTNGTMGLDGFSHIAKFDQYFGRNEFNDDTYFDGNWGIYDEEFLQYSAREMNRMDPPFFATIYTLSSHFPYLLPEKYKGRFKKGRLDIQESVMYTDFALKSFFRTAKKMNWYQNTLFVLVADHTSVSKDPFYGNIAGQYLIPIVFFRPWTEGRGLHTGYAQQLDIMPTLMDYLGYKGSIIAFGNSLLDIHADRFAIQGIWHGYQLFRGDWLLIFEEDYATTLYNIAEDSLLTTNMLDKEPMVADSMVEFLEAFVQQYDERVVNNRLTVHSWDRE